MRKERKSVLFLLCEGINEIVQSKAVLTFPFFTITYYFPKNLYSNIFSVTGFELSMPGI